MPNVCMPELDLANARFVRQQILNMERPEAVTGKHFVMDDFMQGVGFVVECRGQLISQSG